MLPSKRNFAFIDGANLRLSAESLGIVIDYARLHRYLQTKYNVEAVYFFDAEFVWLQPFLSELKQGGYHLVLRRPTRTPWGTKSNCDTELVLHAMATLDSYLEAVVITNDGDFACLVRYLRERNRLRQVIGCNPQRCSLELRRAAGPKFVYLEQVRSRIELLKCTEGKPCEH